MRWQSPHGKDAVRTALLPAAACASATRRTVLMCHLPSAGTDYITGAMSPTRESTRHRTANSLHKLRSASQGAAATDGCHTLDFATAPLAGLGGAWACAFVAAFGL